MATQNDGDVIIGTKLDDSEFSSGLSKLGGTASKAMAAVTAAIGAASIAIVSLGSQFETANAKASTLFGDANVDMQGYQKNMLELSTKTGLAATDLGNTMYDALSAGIPASDDMSEALSFLEQNTKLAKAGFTDVNTATTATSKVLNAYKMDVSETDKIHKVLIQTQNKGITTVNELGSVLSQVTPTAAAMNVQFEQVGAALANMTAQGTPTAQATTQLNQLFAELGKTGTAASDAMKEATQGSQYAGKSFQELMKKGVPLNEILNLMDTYAKKNGKSMLDMFSSIEGGKAALAISGQNSQQFTNNLKDMSTECDVVGAAYDKVTDTFEEKSKKAVNSLKNVGIAAYDKFKEPLKKAMDSAQKSINGLSKELSSGKLGKSVDKIAKGFASLIEITIEVASKAIPILVNGFSLIIDNGELVASAIVGITAAMLIYNNYQKITDALHLVGAVSSLAYGTAHAIMAGNITLATGAMELFNLAVTKNPVGLAVAAIVGLTAAIATLALTTGDGKTASEELRETLIAEKEAIEEAHQATKDKANDSVKEIDNLKRYKDELDGIVDANGNVVAGFEDRASFLVGELASATGMDIKLIGGQIIGYKNLSSEIDKTIEKMRAQAILEAHKEEYTEAIKKQTDALKKLREAEEASSGALKTKEQYIASSIASAKARGSSESEAAKFASDSWNTYYQQYEDNLDKAKSNYNSYTKTIVAYEQSKTDILNGEYNKVNDTINANSSVYETNVNKKKSLIEQEVADLSTSIETLKGMRTIENAETIDSMIKSNGDQLTQKRLGLFALNNEVWAASQEYASAYKYLSDMGSKAFDENGNLVPAAQKKIDEARIKTLELIPDYMNALKDMADKGEGIYDGNGNLTTAAQKKLTDVFIKINELSPDYSKLLLDMVNNGESVFDSNGNLTKATQKKLVDSYSTINKLTPEYAKALKDMADNGESVFDKNGNLTEDAKKKIEQAKSGANSKQADYKNAIAGIANSGKLEIEKADTHSAGKNFVDGAKKGAEKNKGGFLATIGNIASSALKAITSIWDVHSPSKKSEWLSKMLIKGLNVGVVENKDGFIGSVKGIAMQATDSIDNVFKNIDSSKLDSIVSGMKSAAMNNQIKLNQTAKIQADYEVGKAILQVKDSDRPIMAKLDGFIENHIIIGDRETAIALAPLISEEMAFK